MMKQIWLLFMFLTTVRSDTDSWMPIVGPILSAYPCGDNEDITVWFEPGQRLRDSNWYYVFVNSAFPEDSKVIITFDSQVNITFTVRTDRNEYAKMILSEGNVFALHFFEPHGNMGFKVKGTDPGVIPYLTSLSINDVERCDDPRQGYIGQFVAKTIVGDAVSCGRRLLDHSELIVSGASTKPGEWPWHVALYRLDRSTVKYICGGTLISNNLVLTAAHCVTFRGARYPAEILNVILGKYELMGDGKESVEKEVLEIIVHKQFNYRHLRNDIALLKLKTEVIFSDYIQPACLWRHKDNSKLPTHDIIGTIVGWGFDNSDGLSRTLRRATMPIVSEATCLKSSPLFYTYALNENTFCAGYRNGTSPCNGDSGSAFQVFIADEIPRGSKEITGSWHIKGIVSSTLARSDEPICDPEQYVVFTNVANYMNWIDSYL